MQDSTVGTDLCICNCICTDGYFYNIKQPEYSGDFKVYLPDQRTCLYEQSGGELLARNFVQIGSGYYWTPYIIAIAAAIWIQYFWS